MAFLSLTAALNSLAKPPSPALDAAAQAAWKAFTAASSAAAPAGSLLTLQSLNGTPLAAATGAWLSAAEAAATADLGASTVAIASDLQATTHTQQQVFAALQSIDVWAARLGVVNWLAPFGATDWENTYNQQHQSPIGQLTSGIGNAVNGVVQGAAGALGGQQNFIGSAVSSAGNWVAGAASLAGNNPLQAAADAAEAAPALYLGYGFANVIALAAVGDAGVSTAAAISGDKGLKAAATTYQNVTGSVINATVNDPTSDLEAIGGGFLSIAASPAAGAGLLAAAAAGYTKDGFQQAAQNQAANGQVPNLNQPGAIGGAKLGPSSSSSSSSAATSRKRNLLLGAGAFGLAGLGLIGALVAL